MNNIGDIKWVDSMFKRTSIRRYKVKKISETKLAQLKKLEEKINGLNEGIRIQIVEDNSLDIFIGVLGAYGKVNNSPSYVAFIGDEKANNTWEKTGYYGEAFILEATRLDLGTCWVSGTFNSKKVESQIKLGSNEKIYAVTALGCQDDTSNLSEKIMKSLIGSRKRKGISALCDNTLKVDTPSWIKESIEAARIAPSAINMQPWRFIACDDGILVKTHGQKDSQKTSQRLDCGIAMLHIEVAALKNGIRGKWMFLDAPNVSKFIFPKRE